VIFHIVASQLNRNVAHFPHKAKTMPNVVAHVSDGKAMLSGNLISWKVLKVESVDYVDFVMAVSRRKGWEQALPATFKRAPVIISSLCVPIGSILWILLRTASHHGNSSKLRDERILEAFMAGPASLADDLVFPSQAPKLLSSRITSPDATWSRR
jgi:hypothetical protein